MLDAIPTDALTIRQASAATRGFAAEGTIRRWITHGIGDMKLRCYYCGRKVLVSAKDLNNFIDETGRVRSESRQDREVRKLRGARRRREEEYQTGLRSLREQGFKI